MVATKVSSLKGLQPKQRLQLLQFPGVAFASPV